MTRSGATGAGPRVVVVTGAANGIARRFVTDLAARGRDRVVACDLDVEALRAAHDGNGADLRALDVTDASAWQQVLDEVVADHGRVDVVANVAGVLTPGWIHEIDLAEIDRHVDVNIKGVLYGSKLAAEHMVRQGSGHIVNIASMAAIGFTPGNAIYAATKHAVRGFSISMAAELRRHGVAVSTVCPGAVATRMLDDQLDRSEAAVTFSTGRPMTPAEVSELLLDVLDRPRIEVARPNALPARIANALPALGVRLYPVFARLGERAAADLRRRRAAGDGRPTSSAGPTTE